MDMLNEGFNYEHHVDCEDFNQAIEWNNTHSLSASHTSPMRRFLILSLEVLLKSDLLLLLRSINGVANRTSQNISSTSP
jgi:hypothetical protein